MGSEEDNNEKGADSGAGRGLGRVLLRGAIVALITCAVGVGAVVGMRRLERDVADRKESPQPVAVSLSLAPTPDWMPQSLGVKIARSLLPPEPHYNDPALVDEVYDRASRCPWIRTVSLVSKHVRQDDPRLGEVIVNAEFRQAAARVKLPDGKLAYVDRDGYRLPDEVPQYMLLVSDDASAPSRVECFMQADEAKRGARRIHYLEIDGVLAPLPKVGQKWAPATTTAAAANPQSNDAPLAGDLADGLRLVEIMSTRPYVNQIKTVDVRNYNGRISKAEPYLRLTAQVDQGPVTDIRFGRLPLPGGDYEVTTERKLRNLDAYVADHEGHLAGKNRYINLQYDKLHVSFD